MAIVISTYPGLLSACRYDFDPKSGLDKYKVIESYKLPDNFYSIYKALDNLTIYVTINTDTNSREILSDYNIPVIHLVPDTEVDTETGSDNFYIDTIYKHIKRQKKKEVLNDLYKFKDNEVRVVVSPWTKFTDIVSDAIIYAKYLFKVNSEDGKINPDEYNFISELEALLSAIQEAKKCTA